MVLAVKPCRLVYVSKSVFKIVPVGVFVVWNGRRWDGYRIGGYSEDKGDVVRPTEGALGDVVMEGQGLAIGDY